MLQLKKYEDKLWHLEETIVSPIIKYLFGTVRSIYITGCIIWIIIWIFLVLFYSWFHTYSLGFTLSTLKPPYNNCLYLLPFFLSLGTLMWNLKIWRNKQEHGNYQTEVDVIEFSERNANYIILAVTAVFIAASILKGFDFSLQKTFFILFMGLSLSFSVCGVLPLIWMPPKKRNPSLLIWLRHFKTIWYTFSIYLYLAGIFAFAECLGMLHK